MLKEPISIFSTNANDPNALENQPQIDLFGQEDAEPLLPERVRKTRAQKYSFALKGTKSPEEIEASFLAGEFGNLKKAVSHQKQMEKRQLTDALMMDMFSSRTPGNFTDQEMEIVRGLGTVSNLSNPDTVFEEEYANQYLNTVLASVKEDSFFQRALEEDQERTLELVEEASWNIQRKEGYQRVLEDLSAKWTKTPLVRKTEDVIEGFVPFYSSIMQMNNVENVADSWYAGRNILETRRYINTLPPNEAIAEVKRIADELAEYNVLEAQQFVDYMVSFSTSDEWLSTLGQSLDVADVATGAAAGLLARTITKAPRVVQDATKAIRSQSSTTPAPNNPEKVVRDYLKTTYPDLDDSQRNKLYDELTSVDEKPVEDIKAANRKKLKAAVNKRNSGPSIVKAAFKDVPADQKGKVVNQLYRYDYKNKTLYIDTDAVAAQFKDRPWRQVKGKSAPLPEDAFKTPEEWVSFVIRRELLKAQTPRKQKQRTSDYERDINVAALREQERSGLINSKDLDTLDPDSGEIISSAPTNTRGKFLVGQTPKSDGLTPTRRLLRDIVQASKGETTEPSDVLASTGDITAAQNLAALEKITATASVKATGADTRLFLDRQLMKDIPSIFHPEGFLRGAGRFTSKYKEQILGVLNNNAEMIKTAFTETNTVNRLSVSEEAVSVARARWELNQRYKGDINKSAVLDIFPDDELVSRDTQSNTLKVHMHLGRTDGSLFDSDRQAAFTASTLYKIPTDAYVIRQLGDNFYIDVYKDVDETNPLVKDAALTTENTTPHNMWTMLTAWVRTPDDVVSPLERQNRKAAVSINQGLYETLGQIAKPIIDLTNRQKKDLDRVLEFGRSIERPRFQNSKDMTTGVFFNTLEDLDNAYLTVHKRLPTPEESTAYYTAVQINDFEHYIRNVQIYRDKVRQGVERFRVTLPSINNSNGRVGIQWSNDFDGKLVDTLPERKKEAGIMLVDADTGSYSYLRNTQMSTEQLENLAKKITEGYKIVQVANPDQRPFSGKVREMFGTEDVINFLVVKGFEANPLSYKQIPYQAGGHIMYDQGVFIKQGKIRETGYGTHEYLGDVSAAHLDTEYTAKQLLPRMERARELLLNNDPGLDDYVKNNLPWSPAEWRSKFEDWLDPNTGEKIRDAQFQKNSPFTITQPRQGVNDALRGELQRRYKNLEDTVDSEFNLYRNIDKKFAGERDLRLPGVMMEGSETNPVFKIRPARLIDPLPAINDATRNIIQSKSLSDYKHWAVDNFLKQFGPYMRADTGDIRELRRNPINTLYEPRWADNIPVEIKRAGQAARMAVLNILGEPDIFHQTVQRLQAKLHDSVMKNVGQKGSDWVADHQLPTVNDPFRYARLIAFHEKLGMFNPVQLFLNTATLAHVNLISPTHGPAGVMAGILQRRLFMNPSETNVNHFGELASKWGWTKEEFIESFKELDLTDFFHVGGSSAYLDDALPGNVISGPIAQGVSRFLDWGAVFFTESERMVRLSAWNTAFREWRKANPGKKIDARIRNQILDRADLLSVNMTRASNAIWQKGPLSVATQFFGYQVRLGEQLIGKRLTKQEKARLILGYSLLYGFPTGLAVPTIGLPLYETVRKELINRGLMDEVNENPHLETLIDGIPAKVLEYISGGRDIDIASRYGPQALSIFKEIARGDKELSELFTGASGGIIHQNLKAIKPALAMLVSPFLKEEYRYPINTSDLIDAAREISLVNNAYKMYYGLNYGKMVTKGEVTLGDIDKFESVMTGVFGVSPQRLTDSGLLREALEDHKAFQDEVIKVVIKYHRKGQQALANRDAQAAENFFKLVRTHLDGGGFLPNQYGQILGRALQGHEHLLDVLEQQHRDKIVRENEGQVR